MTDVIFGGRRYRPYRGYYQCTQAPCEPLHRAIWELHHEQPVPKGFHVHHKDGNPTNNSIDNLEALSAADHRRRHPNAWHGSPEGRAHLDRIRPSSHEWHRKAESRASQSAKTRAWFDAQPWLDKTCVYCGSAFKAKRPVAKYCTHKCNTYDHAKAKRK